MKIKIIYDNGFVKLYTIDEVKNPLMENGHQLRLYQKIKSKEEFILGSSQEIRS
jgi:hypothetical protein